jgi:hypothetical protein
MTINLGRLGDLNRFVKDDHLGHVLLFVAPKLEMMDTQFGPAEAAICQGIICVTCELGWADVPLFGSYPVPRICSGDDIVPGLLTQGKAQAGKNPPWLLDDVTGPDLMVAQDLADRILTRLGSGKIAVDLDALKGRTEEKFE